MPLDLTNGNSPAVPITAPNRNLTHTLTKLTNRESSTSLIAAHTREPGGAAMVETPLDRAWPEGVFSLGHVAVPFPVDDPLYGSSPSVPPAFGLHIGSLHPVGEKRVLKIPPAQLIRIRHNPLHSIWKTGCDGLLTLNLEAGEAAFAAATQLHPGS